MRQLRLRYVAIRILVLMAHRKSSWRRQGCSCRSFVHGASGVTYLVRFVAEIAVGA